MSDETITYAPLFAIPLLVVSVATGVYIDSLVVVGVSLLLLAVTVVVSLDVRSDRSVIQ